MTTSTSLRPVTVQRTDVDLEARVLALEAGQRASDARIAALEQQRSKLSAEQRDELRRLLPVVVGQHGSSWRFMWEICGDDAPEALRRETVGLDKQKLGQLFAQAVAIPIDEFVVEREAKKVGGATRWRVLGVLREAQSPFAPFDNGSGGNNE